jgi:hypothetical protein
VKPKKRVCYGVLPVPAALGRRLRAEWSAVEQPGRIGGRREDPAGPRSRKDVRRGAE